MLTYSFSNIGSDTLYMHLYKCIKNDIITGTLKPYTKLPSKRNFAKNLGISIITVENAYAQLCTEGYLYSIAKKGYFVADVNYTAKQSLLESNGINITFENKKDYIADFSGRNTISENFPFSIWSKLVREILLDKQQKLLENPPCGGLIELRQAIASHLKQFRNMTVCPEQIIIGAGAEYLYNILIQLLGHDKIYAVENPSFKKISQIYNHNNVICKYLNMDHEGIMINELNDKAPDIVHISPAHHFPTGIVMPIKRRYELLAWSSEKNGRYIIEDDYDSEFRMIGKPIPTIQSIDLMEKVIYMNTLTKSLASTIRISYMVLPPHLINKYYNELSFYSCTVSNFEQYILYRFINDGYFEKHINRMRTYYYHQRNLILSAITNSPYSSKLKIFEENAGLHFLLKIDTKYTDTEFCDNALKKGLVLVPLSQYYNKNEKGTVIPQHIFVMNYSSINESTINEAIDILCSCI